MWTHLWITSSQYKRVTTQSQNRVLMRLIQPTRRTQLKKSQTIQLVRLLLLISIAWSIVYIGKSKNTFDAPDSTRHDFVTNTPSSSNRQTRSIALGERERERERERALFLLRIVLWDIIRREEPAYLLEYFVLRVMKNIEQCSACCSVYTR